MRTISKHAKIAAALAVMLLASGGAFAKGPTAFEKAELAQLSPQLRSQVKARLTDGQTVRGILETMLLNNIKAKHPASRIVAMDFGRGVAVVQLSNRSMRTVQFDTTTLAIKS